MRAEVNLMPFEPNEPIIFSGCNGQYSKHTATLLPLSSSHRGITAVKHRSDPKVSTVVLQSAIGGGSQNRASICMQFLNTRVRSALESWTVPRASDVEHLFVIRHPTNEKEFLDDKLAASFVDELREQQDREFWGCCGSFTRIRNPV